MSVAQIPTGAKLSVSGILRFGQYSRTAPARRATPTRRTGKRGERGTFEVYALAPAPTRWHRVRPMRPFLLLFLAVSLSAHAQAVRPAPMPVPRPPAYTPGYAPGTPPEPVYAPNGAGLPGERVPGTVAPAVPHSKGRILPREPDGAPGLWAADGASRASSASEMGLFEVDVPIPADPDAASLAKQCAVDMSDARGQAIQHHIRNYSMDVRACVAAKALAHCATALRKNQESSPLRDAGAHRRLEAHAESLVSKLCGSPLSDDETKTLERVTNKWEQITRERYQVKPR